VKTSREISTISYNTDGFLQFQLNRLISEGIISDWAYIEHIPEGDELKAHKHLILIPSCRVDTLTLSERFREPDDLHPNGLPLGIIDIHVSKFDDWYLYGIHDDAYLASKGLVKKYHYSRSDFKVSNQDWFVQRISRVKFGSYKRQQMIIDALDCGRTVNELLRSGLIPINQYGYWAKFYSDILENQIQVGDDGSIAFTDLSPSSKRLREEHQLEEYQDDLGRFFPFK